eukprot:1767752-Amphidinium_carterae.1
MTCEERSLRAPPRAILVNRSRNSNPLDGVHTLGLMRTSSSGIDSDSFDCVLFHHASHDLQHSKSGEQTQTSMVCLQHFGRTVVFGLVSRGRRITRALTRESPKRNVSHERLELQSGRDLGK